MVIFGLLLLVLAAAAILAAVFTAEIHDGQVRLLSAIDMSPLTLFLIGLAAGIAVWIGFGFLRVGLRRARARHKEQKRLGRLATEVEDVERRRDHTDEDIRSADDSNRRSL